MKAHARALFVLSSLSLLVAIAPAPLEGPGGMVSSDHQLASRAGAEMLAQGGNASELWKLDRAIAVIDRRLGANTLRKLAAAHRFGGRPVGLPQLWLDLGIQLEDSGFTFDETAALSPVRQAIIAPP